MLKLRTFLLAALCVSALSGGARLASATPIVFNFDADTEGSSNATDTDPVSGLSLSYFGALSACSGSPFGGSALASGVCGPGGGSFVVFSSELSSVSFDYATDGTGPVEVDVVSEMNGTLATTIFLDPSEANDFEGTITISGVGPFDTLIFEQGTFDGPGYAIDNVGATMPEPSSIVLLGTGMLGFVGMVRRRFTV